MGLKQINPYSRVIFLRKFTNNATIKTLIKIFFKAIVPDIGIINNNIANKESINRSIIS